jgi:hypothetical protein
MKSKGLICIVVLTIAAAAPATMASTTWYVNGVNGNDNNDCISIVTPCKTIGHAITLTSSSDSIIVAAATYTENLTIDTSLTIVGADARTTIIDGGGTGPVVGISTTAGRVVLSRFTVTGGHLDFLGGAGISNGGILTIHNCTITGNSANSSFGGGLFNEGTLTIYNSTISGNSVTKGEFSGGLGGGVYNDGLVASINNSTITGNFTSNGTSTQGGGIYSARGTLTINNSTITNNSAHLGGGISSSFGVVVVQNSVIAYNTSGGDCSGSIVSNGFNIGSDASCNFTSTGDLKNTDPKLGPTQYNGGQTQTRALLSGSPAIDAGNPNGCTDGQGRPLITDQRGAPRPDQEDLRCDMGAYERQ